MVGLIYHHSYDFMACMRASSKYFYRAIYILQELPGSYGIADEIKKISFRSVILSLIPAMTLFRPCVVYADA
jgi:hypothetical protein